jgi:hypothetical protein
VIFADERLGVGGVGKDREKKRKKKKREKKKRVPEKVHM